MNKTTLAMIIAVSLCVAVISLNHLLSSARAREVEAAITAPTNQIIKEMAVINFLQGHEVARDAAWWLETPNNLRMAEVEILLQNKEVSDLVFGVNVRAKTITLHELLYHQFVIQCSEEKASGNITIEPAQPVTSRQ
jgi:hypothetical protein